MSPMVRTTPEKNFIGNSLVYFLGFSKIVYLVFVLNGSTNFNRSKYQNRIYKLASTISGAETKEPSNRTAKERMQILRMIGKYINAPNNAVRGISKRTAANTCTTPIKV